MTRKIKMIMNMTGASNEHGSQTRQYLAGELLPLDYPWQRALAQVFVDSGAALEHKEPVLEKKEEKPDPQKRAHKPAEAPKVVKAPPKKPTTGNKAAGILASIGKKISG